MILNCRKSKNLCNPWRSEWAIGICFSEHARPAARLAESRWHRLRISVSARARRTHRRRRASPLLRQSDSQGRRAASGVACRHCPRTLRPFDACRRRAGHDQFRIRHPSNHARRRLAHHACCCPVRRKHGPLDCHARSLRVQKGWREMLRANRGRMARNPDQWTP